MTCLLVFRPSLTRLLTCDLMGCTVLRWPYAVDWALNFKEPDYMRENRFTATAAPQYLRNRDIATWTDSAGRKPSKGTTASLEGTSNGYTRSNWNVRRVASPRFRSWMNHNEGDYRNNSINIHYFCTALQIPPTALCESQLTDRRRKGARGQICKSHITILIATAALPPARHMTRLKYLSWTRDDQVVTQGHA